MARNPSTSPTPPRVLNLGEAKRRLYASPDPKQVLYLVAQEFEDEAWVERIPNAKLFGLREPLPSRDVVRDLLTEARRDIKNGLSLSIACQAGVNRSASVATILHLHQSDLDYPEALYEVRRQRTVASPYWLMQTTIADVALELDMVAPRQLKGLSKATEGSPRDIPALMEQYPRIGEVNLRRYAAKMKEWG